MDLLSKIEEIISQAASEVVGSDVRAFVESTKDSRHGDLSSNVAMLMSKVSGQNLRDLATQIASKIDGNKLIQSVEVAGPGFINITLSADAWVDLIASILSNPGDYGASNIGGGEKINLEYVSANPTGPVHIGHVRGAIVGDVLAQILKKTGFNVVEEYYINDAGAQTDVLAQSAFLRYRQAMGADIGEIPVGMYPGEYLVSIGKALADRYGDSLTGSAEDLAAVKQFAIETLLDDIKSDLRKLHVHHDVFSSEKAILAGEDVQDAIDALRAKGLVYEAVLEQPKGKLKKDWVSRKQLLFRSSEFGDSADRPLTKDDGSWTYFMADIAYQYDKVKRGYKSLILILGRDHVGYAARIKSAVESIADVSVEIIFYDIVNLMHGENVIKMSKRSGNFLTAQDVIDVIGSDAIRFIMLSRSSEMVLDFDLEKAKEATKDNPVFYIQYAHARGCSVLRKAKDEGYHIDGASANISLLTSAYERAMLRMMAEWPRSLSIAATRREPHKIAFYLQNLAKTFHALWNSGVDSEELRCIISSKPELTATRLIMIRAFVAVIAAGLRLLKVEPLESM